jgi:hypothetical protein
MNSTEIERVINFKFYLLHESSEAFKMEKSAWDNEKICSKIN